ncbi:MAG TPA: hypothetical protein VFA71_06260 [Terriglobales bacterium]|nr:hypothetical protein [Terriglobales bacterium]
MLLLNTLAHDGQAKHGVVGFTWDPVSGVYCWRLDDLATAGALNGAGA